MAKQGEVEYLGKIGEAGVWHAVGKPFTDPYCPAHLMQVGAIMFLLPPPPARLLDLGCGTGWTGIFFARRGYDVLGVDIAPDMIDHANRLRDQAGLDNLRFAVSDYEDTPFEGEFDCAVFYDALHHAVDEEAALRMVWRALRPGGVCVTSEPGDGHARAPASRHAVERYNVTERDMPPRAVIAAGRHAGFRDFRVYPHASDVGTAVFGYRGRLLRRLAAAIPPVRKLGSIALTVRILLYRAGRGGIVVLVK
jgi:SAM-dependent methyltransferase